MVVSWIHCTPVYDHQQTHHFTRAVLNVGGISLDNWTSTFSCFFSASAFFICLTASASISRPYTSQSTQSTTFCNALIISVRPTFVTG